MCNGAALKFLLFLCVFHLKDVNGAIEKGVGDGQQEWGYITVREHSHMFWWLYYTTSTVNDNYESKPLIIWLQGGPGQSSTGYGNFMEIGPLDINLKARNSTWVKDYNVLFIDSPVGTGFSYVDHNLHYCKTNAQIGIDLLTLITKFYNKFSKFRKTPTYIISQSYGGKMTVEFANFWYKKQAMGEIKSNLKGIALGSPWISPIHSIMEYAPSLLYTGMIDKSGYDKLQIELLKTKKAIEEESWTTATKQLDIIETMIFDETDNMDLFNVLYRSKSSSILEKNHINSVYGDYLGSVNRLAYFMNTFVKEKLNMKVDWGHAAALVSKNLEEDFMKPVTMQVESLLNDTDINVFVYNGQLDLAVNSVGTLKWIEELQWRNKEHWKNAKREPFVINGIIEGFVKHYGKLKMFWVNRAGHMAIVDNPAAISSILNDLTTVP